MADFYRHAAYFAASLSATWQGCGLAEPESVKFHRVIALPFVPVCVYGWERLAGAMRTVRFRRVNRVFLHFHEDRFFWRDCFSLKASKFFVFFAPTGAEALFFAPPKKSTQKKGGPKAQPDHSFSMSDRVPCASRENRRMRNSQSRYARKLKQSACFIRFSLRCSAAPTGGVDLPPAVSH